MGRRAAARVMAAATSCLPAPLPVAAWQVPRSAAQVYSERPFEAPAAEPASPAVSYDPRKPTAVVVLVSQGTSVADALPPFEVLAVTQRFNLFMAAADPRPMPLTGGADLLPDLSFTELDDLLPTTPEVIVLPQIRGEGPGGPVTTWVRQQHRRGDPLLVSVCVGAEILADAGVLDGRPVTSHWLKLIGMRRDFLPSTSTTGRASPSTAPAPHRDDRGQGDRTSGWPSPALSPPPLDGPHSVWPRALLARPLLLAAAGGILALIRAVTSGRRSGPPQTRSQSQGKDVSIMTVNASDSPGVTDPAGRAGDQLHRPARPADHPGHPQDGPQA